MNLKQISSHSEALDKLKALQKARNEIAEKIKNHDDPEGIPKMQSVLEKYEKAITEIEKIISGNLHRSVNPIGTEYIKLPGGKFEMGDNEIKDNPPHQVTLSPFEMAKTLVTQNQWRELMGQSISPYFGSRGTGLNKDDHPMESVNWHDSINYCKALSLKADDISTKIKEKIKKMDSQTYNDYALKNPKLKLYRLPTEAEWEYAAKAGKNYKYGTADGESPTNETAVYSREREEGTVPVTSTKPNLFGLYDMAGHLYQWTASWYQDNFYKNGKKYKNPIGPKTGTERVCRGSTFCGRFAFLYSASNRSPNSEPDIRDQFTGFRPVRYIGKDELR